MANIRKLVEADLRMTFTSGAWYGAKNVWRVFNKVDLSEIQVELKARQIEIAQITDSTKIIQLDKKKYRIILVVKFRFDWRTSTCGKHFTPIWQLNELISLSLACG